MEGGGKNPNSTVIIENNTDNLNISEFGEPIIYIKPSKKSVTVSDISGKDKDNIPVFGYLTIGKELLLKLLSMQTNQNVLFKKQQSTYEKSKSILFDYAQKNPGITILVATLLTNGLTKAMIESGIPGLKSIPHVKDVVTSICSNIFGDWVGPYLAVWMPSADKSKSTVWSQIWPEQKGDLTGNIMHNFTSNAYPTNTTSNAYPTNTTSIAYPTNTTSIAYPTNTTSNAYPTNTTSIAYPTNTTIPNSSSISPIGGKIIKSRKNKKTRKSRKNKKITRSSYKKTRRYKK